jgi:hypothetical protein
MAKPWPSVVVPSHDRWLGAALQSLVDQNATEVEVIGIDASATDASLWIIAGGFSAQLDIRPQTPDPTWHLA